MKNKKTALYTVIMLISFLYSPLLKAQSLTSGSGGAPAIGANSTTTNTNVGIRRANPYCSLDIIGNGAKMNAPNFDACLRVEGGLNPYTSSPKYLSSAILWSRGKVTNVADTNDLVLNNFVIGGPGNTASNLGDYYFGLQGDPSITTTFNATTQIYGQNRPSSPRMGSFKYYMDVFIDNAAHDGKLGIGTTAPTAQLHTTGSVRFQGLTTGAATRTIVSDASGNLFYQNGVALSSTCNTVNFIPKVSGTNTMSCSQIQDNGTGVGIGMSAGTYNGANVFTAGSPVAATPVKLDVNGLTRSISYVATSDERMKKEITPLENALSKVVQLNGKMYKWRNTEFPEKGFDNKLQAGFLAQEIAEIIPEAVVVDAEGIYGLNYNMFIPYLTEAIKDQQEQLDEKEIKIASLENRMTLLENALASCCTSNETARIKNSDATEQAHLDQNNPNPFTENTIINYYIPSISKKAALKVYTLSGEALKSINITATGKGQITFDAGELPSGTYVYNLLVDGKQVDSKWMTLTK